MMFELPDHDTLYQALLSRDPAHEGRAFVAVTSTGIFCRLYCPARVPKSENCRFFETVVACLEAGFRPCKRCRPLERPGAEPLVVDLLERLRLAPERRWGEPDLIELGYDPSTVRRAFNRQLGLTFLELARLNRLRHGFTALANGEPVIEAQLDAGYASPSAFRDAFAALLGKAPGKLNPKPRLQAQWFDTALGAMIAVADDQQLHLLEFADRKALVGELKRLEQQAGEGIGIGRTAIHDQLERELGEYFSGQSAEFTVPMAYHGSAFAKTVWRELCQIPAGITKSYAELAEAIGQPTATRAVARANGANQIAILIPCHRVIGADGSLTGYGGGLWRKRQLIDIEAKFQRS